MTFKISWRKNKKQILGYVVAGQLSRCELIADLSATGLGMFMLSHCSLYLIP
jgi:hypothetical protein